MKFVINGGRMLDDVMDEIRNKLAMELQDDEHSSLDDSVYENRYLNFKHIIIEVLI